MDDSNWIPLGLAWTYDCERTPALAPEQVAELAGRRNTGQCHHYKGGGVKGRETLLNGFVQARIQEEGQAGGSGLKDCAWRKGVLRVRLV